MPVAGLFYRIEICLTNTGYQLGLDLIFDYRQICQHRAVTARCQAAADSVVRKGTTEQEEDQWTGSQENLVPTKLCNIIHL